MNYIVNPKVYQAPFRSSVVRVNGGNDLAGIGQAVKATCRGYADVILIFTLSLTIAINHLQNELLGLMN